MPIRYIDLRRGFLRRALHRLQIALPKGLRVGVWERTGRKVLRERGYDRETPLFQAIELETRTRCNSTCSFCAANVLTDNRPDIYMPEALYLKILDELAGLDYKGTVRFFVNNEPLLDKRTADFVRQAKERMPQSRTEVHTNGLKLNPRNGRELLEAGLDQLYINNYTETEEMHLGVARFLEEVAPDFPDCEVVFHMRHLKEQLANRAGTAPNAATTPAALPLPCVLPFEEIVVTADGRVTICCQDHYFDAAVGNVKTESLVEIWRKPAFETLRSQLRQADRSHHPLCAVCDHRGFKQEHLPEGNNIANKIVGQLYQP